MIVAPIENQALRPPDPEPPMSGVPRPLRIRSDDDELDRLHRRYATTRDQSVRTELATVYDGFARSLARRFPSRRETREDLVQVARLGLLHALDRFDPRRNRPFRAFARVTIIGELKRHIRDHSWSMRVPRSLQEDFLVTVRAVDDLTQERGRSPRIAEVAARTGLSEEQILEAMELGTAYQPMSLDAPCRDLDPRGNLGVTDPSFTVTEGRALIDTLLLRLSERDREIFRLRFGEELTQAQIAARFGVSQMCVSRVLSRGLAKLRILVQTEGMDGAANG